MPTARNPTQQNRKTGLGTPCQSQGLLGDYVSAHRPDEIARMVGPETISECGHTFRRSLGPVKTVAPTHWSGVGSERDILIAVFNLGVPRFNGKSSAVGYESAEDFEGNRYESL